MKIRMHTGENRALDFRVDEKGTLWYKDRICVPKEGDFRQTIMDEAHNSAYSIYPGSTKMYVDIRQKYWWSGMKQTLHGSSPIVILVKESRPNIRSQQDCCNLYPSRFGNGMR
jgi:hypothetical protein